MKRVGFVYIVLLVLCLPLALSAVSVPITTTQNTGFTSGGTAITANGALDGEWMFYNAQGIQYGGRVVTSGGVLTAGGDANDPTSSWISPDPFWSGTAWRTTANNNANGTQDSKWATYTAASTFTVPGYSPGVSTWYLVLGATVWGDDTITGYGLTSGPSPTGGTPVTNGTLSATRTGEQHFSLFRAVAPGTYTLYFNLNNATGSPYNNVGFRLNYDTYAGISSTPYGPYVTPEPSEWVLMLTSGVALAFAAYRRRKSTSQSSTA